MTPRWFSLKQSAPPMKALELCACYHNGLPLGNAQTEVSDLDFISCWLAEEETLSSASEVRVGTCDVSRNQPRSGSLAGARS